MNPKYPDGIINFRDILQSTFGLCNAKVFKLQIVDLKSCVSCANMPRKLTGHLALVHLVDSSKAKQSIWGKR